MNKFILGITAGIFLMSGLVACTSGKQEATQKGEWTKYEQNPVLGSGDFGTIFSSFSII